MTQRQPVTVHYRRLEDVGKAFGSQSLEAAIRKAMSTAADTGTVADHWKRRAWVTSAGGADTLLMNLYNDGSDYYFGDVTQYTIGHMQALLASADTPMLAVEQQPPPDGKEYVHSLMYWLVRGNHALIIHSRSLTTKQLEEYFTWFLKDRTAAVGPLAQVILQVKFDAGEVGGDLDDIKEIIVGGARAGDFAPAAGAAPARDQETEVETYKEVEKRRSWQERAVDVLRAVFNNEADVTKFMESIPDDADLEVSVHIGYKTKRRKVTRAPMQQALRNLPEGEITAIGKHGQMSQGDIRLSYPANIKRIGSLLDPVDVERALLQAYDHFAANGKI